MAKTIEVIKYVIISVICVLLQMYLINNSRLFNVAGNIVLMYVLMVAVYSKINVSLVIAFCLGIIMDMIVGFKIGPIVIIYVLTCIGVIFTSNIYKRESRQWVLIYASIVTVIYEIYMAIYYQFQIHECISIFMILIVCIKAIIINIALAYCVRYAIIKWIRKNTDEYEV